jgi:3-oxoacyl-[acyl-carrier protein] reductase
MSSDNSSSSQKVAVVCASSKGIGRAVAMAFVHEGYKVIINGRDKEKLEQTRSEIASLAEVFSVPVDIASPGGAEKLFNVVMEKYNRIDILINNVGGPKPGKFMDKSTADWQEAFELLFLSFIKLTRLAIPIMQANNWGRIVNITSITAKEPAPGLILSNPFRAAVISVSKTLAQEYAKDNILINSICPASILTERTEFLLQDMAKKENATYETIYNRIAESMPMKKLQSPEEVANIVAFLCSEKGTGITGTSISVDGGNSKFLF